MESSTSASRPDDVRAELAAADLARERLSESLRLPAGLVPALGVAIAVQIGTAAVGITRQTAAGMALVGVGLVLLLAVAWWALGRFRHVNGVRVDGFARQVVLGTGVTATGAYVQADPASRTAGASPRMLALLAVGACVGLAVLVVTG